MYCIYHPVTSHYLNQRLVVPRFNIYIPNYSVLKPDRVPMHMR